MLTYRIRTVFLLWLDGCGRLIPPCLALDGTSHTRSAASGGMLILKDCLRLPGGPPANCLGMSSSLLVPRMSRAAKTAGTMRYACAHHGHRL